MKTRQLALYAMMGALLFAAKMAMAPLPNISPAALLVMLYAVCFGWQGLYPVYIYIFLEIAVWGVHLWTVCYLYVWLILFVLARLLQRMESSLSWAILSGGFGLLFGALCAPVYWITGGWASAVSWWIAGIPWDLVHGAGNFVMALILFKPLRKWLTRLHSHFVP